MAHEAANYAPVGSEKKLGDNLVDIHQQRLELMDKYGVEMQVLSLTSPGPQGMHSQTTWANCQATLIQKKLPPLPLAQMTSSYVPDL